MLVNPQLLETTQKVGMNSIQKQYCSNESYEKFHYWYEPNREMPTFTILSVEVPEVQ